MIVFCILLAGVGAAGGWLASMRKSAPAAEEDAQEAEAAKGLSPQALKNLGVAVQPAKLATWIRTIEIQAVVSDRPENRIPVETPLAGRVTAVHVVTGGRVAAGQPIATIARDPIPRPKTELTADLLLPISESVHEAAEALRNAQKRLDIASRELARLRKLNGNRKEGDLPLIAANRLIQLGYEKERAELDVTNARHELERHGMTVGECSSIEGGGECPPNPSLWSRVLRKNGLWTDASDRIVNALPASQRELPWAIAALGELTAAGLATESLAAVLENTPAAAARFAEAAGLLLQGTPLETVNLLAREGALEPTMIVRAPVGGAPDFDVHALPVRPGERVAAGADIAELHDARRLWLEVMPVGAEITAVVSALERKTSGVASPLIDGAGPTFDAVSLTRMESHGERGAIGYAELENEPLGSAAADAPRTWRLRPGTRYVLDLPSKRLEKRWVLPADAVTDDGAELVVFVEDGDTFRAVPVHVEDRNADSVVLANDGSLFPGDPVVVKGAFALGLALSKRGGDDHGHGHSHN